MKKSSLKLLAIVAACLMIVTVALVAPVSAEEAEIVAADSMYVTAVNVSVTAASGTIFTKDFNGTNTITTTEANLKWVTFFIAKPTSTANVYEVVTIDMNSDGQPNTELTIPEGGFIYVGHCDDADKTSDAYKNSAANLKAIVALTVGSQVTVSGVDFAAEEATANANIVAGAVEVSVDETSSEAVSEVVSETESSVGEDTESSVVVEDDNDSSTTKVSTTTDSSSDNDEEDSNILLYVGIGAAAVVLIALIAFVATRKKK